MNPDWTHSYAATAIGERKWTEKRSSSIQEFKPEIDRWSTHEPENLSSISISSSILALHNALLPNSGSAGFEGVWRDGITRESHASLCLGKRVFDILFACCALVSFLPILLACAVAMKMESAGPLFFRQRRIGTNGVPFHILKFRTMVPDAESVLAAYLAVDPQAKAEWEADRKLKNDPRITRIGATMRKFSLDELPQFWNVVKGEMSIVGPRPIVQAEVQFYGFDFESYTAVRPGITGLWQVSGRNDVSYPNRVALDCKYVRTWRAQLDFSILVKTVSTVLRAAGAY